jgi:putative membrane-bound dehydrogenase-like protein
MQRCLTRQLFNGGCGAPAALSFTPGGGRRSSICWFLVVILVTSALGAAEDAENIRKNYNPATAPLPPIEAAATMVVPAGFRVTLFAGEPDVLQPVALTHDDRGRLWVAEAYQYPDHSSTPNRDRLLILEDTDGDGRHDRRTVFYEGLNYVSGVEVGFGGVWVMSPPYFFFIPDRDRDDRPDGPPVVLLDGFGNHANAHNMANNLSWGPDGWLYGTHGRTNWSTPGKPGTPQEQRTQFDGGVWRYHPVRHVWEPYTDGTTNPWGIDWNDYGHGFMCTSVDPHLYHVIQGAHHEPWRNRDSSRYAYQRIPTIADHLHFTGKQTVQDGLGSAAEDAAGGGHSHAGTLVYLGDNWPGQYRNGVFANNIHGHRINHDAPARAGSGYTASHRPTLMQSRDPWYMGVVLRYGPDGSVYAADWSDTESCHSYKNTRRETGRIYRISYGSPNWDRRDVATLTDTELVQRQLHANDWHVRHARRLLQERAAAGGDMTTVHTQLRKIFAENPDVTRKLRALWSLHVTGGLDDTQLRAALGHADENVRGWAIQLLCENRAPSAEAVEQFTRMAASSLVRLYLASALQRIEPSHRWDLATALLAHGEDARDQNLPLMIWYGIEPLAGVDMERFASLANAAKLSLVRRHIARRASEPDVRALGVAAVVKRLGQTLDAVTRLDLVAGMLEGLKGVRSLPMPEGWAALSDNLRSSSNRALSARALELSLVFDDPAALLELNRQAADSKATPEARVGAIEALAARQPKDLAPLLLKLTADPVTRRSAVRALAAYDHPDTAARLLAAYPNFDAATQADTIQTLVARPKWAMRLLDAVESGVVPRAQLTAYAARQMDQIGDAALTARVKALWGEIRPTSAEKTQQIERWRRTLTPAVLATANPSSGRKVYERLCSACHRLFDEGGTIGPDLTGAQRTNPGYLLENIIDPNAAVPREFQVNTIRTTSGRVVSGFVVAENASALTVASLNERVTIPVAEIQHREQSAQSMMPEGLLQGLKAAEVRDLIAYLGSAAQTRP